MAPLQAQPQPDRADEAAFVNFDSEATPITLSKADWAKFLEVLDTPPAPNDELKALFAEDGPKGDNQPFTVAE